MDTTVRSVGRWTYPLTLAIGVAWSLFFALDHRFFPRQWMEDWVARWRIGRAFLSPEFSGIALAIVAMAFTVWAPVSTVDAWRKLGWTQFWRMRWEAPFALLLWMLAGGVSRESWLWINDGLREAPALIGAIIRALWAVLAIITFTRWVQRRRAVWLADPIPSAAESTMSPMTATATQSPATPLLPSSPLSRNDV